jgi:hypothetical protein
MSLPFLKRNNKDAGIAGVMTIHRNPDKEESHEEHDGVHMAARDLIDAVKADDVKGVAAAMRAAFEIMDSEPHVEGEHVEPHSYESQKD